MIQHSTLWLSSWVVFIDDFFVYIYSLTIILGTVPPTAVVKVPVTEPSVVTLKTHVDTGVLDHYGPLIPIDPDTVKDVIKAGTTVGEGLAIGALFAELLPMFAFLGKRDVTEQTRAFEDFVNTVMEAQNLDWYSFWMIW